MNGILPRADGLPLATLAAILNTRPVDYAFRRGAVPLANAHFQANKQFIAPLPIPADLPDELHTHSERLCAAWQAIHDERGAYLAHLASVTVADPYTLAGSRALTAYDEHSTTEILAILDRVRAKLAIDPRARSVRDQLTADLEASSARIAALRRTTETLEAAVEPSSPTRTASAPPARDDRRRVP